MTNLYPLRFAPIFRQYIWGGRRLASALGKQLPEGEMVAESWELVDHGQDQSQVAFGSLQGTTLGHLVSQDGPALLGMHHPQTQFPLLFKFLDANRNLSVQVHPNDQQGRLLDPPDLGKTEAWVVIEAEPGSCLYTGLKQGFDRKAFERELARGTAELCLHRIAVQPGDCVFIPAGTVHALGEGIVIAEIQQASDTTFRLFDWNRVDSEGNPRPLHIEQGLAVTDFERGPVQPQTPQPADRPGFEQLVDCEKFVLERGMLQQSSHVGGDDRFHILAVLDGELMVEGDPSEQPLRKGQTMLLPACCGSTSVTPRGSTTLLDMYLP